MREIANIAAPNEWQSFLTKGGLLKLSRGAASEAVEYVRTKMSGSGDLDKLRKNLEAAVEELPSGHVMKGCLAVAETTVVETAAAGNAGESAQTGGGETADGEVHVSETAAAGNAAESAQTGGGETADVGSKTAADSEIVGGETAGVGERTVGASNGDGKTVGAGKGKTMEDEKNADAGTGGDGNTGVGTVDVQTVVARTVDAGKATATATEQTADAGMGGDVEKGTTGTEDPDNTDKETTKAAVFQARVNNGTGVGGQKCKWWREGVTDQEDFKESLTLSALVLKGSNGGRSVPLVTMPTGPRSSIPSMRISSGRDSEDYVICEMIGHADNCGDIYDMDVMTYRASELDAVGKGRFKVDQRHFKRIELSIFDTGMYLLLTY